MLQAPGSNVATIHSAEQPPADQYGKAEWRNLKDVFLYKHTTHPQPNGEPHTALIPRLSDKEEFGNDAVVYYGETSAEDRATAKELFIRGDVPIFIATAAAAGRGVDGLQKICSDAIYYSQSYNAIERWQSEDRTNRIGSKHTSSYITLIGRGGADRAIMRNIAGKTALSDLVLDGKTQVKNSLADAIDIMRGIG